jgi:hypothetical protein
MLGRPAGRPYEYGQYSDSEATQTWGNDREIFNLRDNESTPDFGYEETVAIL